MSTLSKYIRNMQDCVFCRIVEKKSEANIIFEDDVCLVFTPRESIAKGHVLVIPKAHSNDIFDTNDETLKALIVFAKKIALKVVKECNATGVNLLHASGKDAQQSVPHFHLHIVPRYPDDKLDLWLKNKL